MIALRVLVLWLEISLSTFYDWRKRYGKFSEHNASIPPRSLAQGPGEHPLSPRLPLRSRGRGGTKRIAEPGHLVEGALSVDAGACPVEEHLFVVQPRPLFPFPRLDLEPLGPLAVVTGEPRGVGEGLAWARVTRRAKIGRGRRVSSPRYTKGRSARRTLPGVGRVSQRKSRRRILFGDFTEVNTWIRLTMPAGGYANWLAA